MNLQMSFLKYEKSPKGKSFNLLLWHFCIALKMVLHMTNVHGRCFVKNMKNLFNKIELKTLWRSFEQFLLLPQHSQQSPAAEATEGV